MVVKMIIISYLQECLLCEVMIDNIRGYITVIYRSPSQNSSDLQQLVNEPSHILPNSSSCTDLISTDQLSLVVSSGMHPSLHANCHHEIIYCKLNLKIEYPPRYQRLVWNFKKASITSIRKAIHTVNWAFLFFNKIVHEQVSVFNNTLMNIFSNYILHKFVTIDDKNPPWMNKKIKNKVIKKTTFISYTFQMARVILIIKSYMILEMKFYR